MSRALHHERLGLSGHLGRKQPVRRSRGRDDVDGGRRLVVEAEGSVTMLRCQIEPKRSAPGSRVITSAKSSCVSTSQKEPARNWGNSDSRPLTHLGTGSGYAGAYARLQVDSGTHKPVAPRQHSRLRTLRASPAHADQAQPRPHHRTVLSAARSRSLNSAKVAARRPRPAHRTSDTVEGGCGTDREAVESRTHW